MTVYVLCDLYPPAWAPRVAYLTQYLGRYGYEPIVFAEEVGEHQLFEDFTAPCPVFHIKPCSRIIPRAGLAIGELLLEIKDRAMTRAIARLCREHRLPKPSIILALSYRKFPLRSASTLAKRWGIPWVADCRDIVEQYSRGDFLPRPLSIGTLRLHALERWIAQRYIAQRNRAIRSAHTLCTVSRWHAEVLSAVHPNVSVIYNGYDATLFYPRPPVRTERFRIVFTGRLLSLAMRNPTMLLDCLESSILRDREIDLVCYTDDYSAELLQSLRPLTGRVRLVIRPMVPSRQVPELLAEASLVLLLGNQEQEGGPHGMISTKLFEAMAMNRPIVLLPDSTSQTAHLVRQSRLGIATCEPEELTAYLDRLYNQWLNLGYTLADDADTDFIGQYTRQSQAQAFARLLDRAIGRD